MTYSQNNDVNLPEYLQLESQRFGGVGTIALGVCPISGQCLGGALISV